MLAGQIDHAERVTGGGELVSVAEGLALIGAGRVA